MKQTVYIGLGANLGSPPMTFNRACQLLQSDICITRYSSLYQSAPFGYEDQPAFINAAIQAVTELSIPALLEHLQAVERVLGKKVVRINGPRCIDLDLLLYGNEVYQSASIAVPHAALAQRDFAMLPLVEMMPDIEHPELKVSLQQLCQQLPTHFVHDAPLPWQRPPSPEQQQARPRA